MAAAAILYWTHGIATAAPVGGHPTATAPLTASQVVANVVAQNPLMHSYQADVTVACRLLGFPYLGARLEGRTYFKRPNNFEVVFTRLPSYGHGFERLYSDIGDPSNWPAVYDISLTDDVMINDHRDIVLRLVKKIRGMIDHEDVAIDPVLWHIDNMQWFYYNGGYVSMSQDFRYEGSFLVLSAQHATIRIPHVHAMAEANYLDYHTNVAIDDAVFTKNEGR
ncbi:MAG TPA: hypothetical protein VGD50_00885 [Candidatus Baltobacteraceae bacterium]